MSISSNLSRLRILCVEDSRDDIRLIERHLSIGGLPCDVLSVYQKEKLSQVLAESGAHVILSDFKLPGFTGIEALQALKPQAKYIPFILVTGALPDELAAECIKQGADDYILKSNLSRLVTAIRNALEKKRVEAEKDRALRAVEEAHAQLRRSEERFRSLIEHSSDVISMLDERGAVKYTSPAVTRVLGYDTGDFSGRTLFDLVHIEDLPAAKALFARLLERPQVITSLFRYAHKDGSWRWIETVADNLLSHRGVEAIVCNFRDVTERMLTEERVRNTLREKELLLNQVQKALASVKTLQGLLPICAHCKKVRDDKGYWNEVEVYVRDHSNAEFSHGLCPICLQKHYGQYL